MEEKDTIFNGLENTEAEASYFQRLFTTVIDIALSVLLVVLVYFVIPHQFISTITGNSSIGRYILIFLLMEGYRLTSLLAFGKTIGMMVCNLKYLNSSLQPLSTKEKLIASLVVRSNKIRYYKNN